jgi:Zn-dependent protease with chaperone function
MIEFNATFFDGITAQDHTVRVRFEAGQLEVIGTEVRFQKPATALRIEPVLGKTSRVIQFKSGEKLVTRDFAAVAALEQVLGVNKGMNLVHLFEQSWRLVLVSFVGLMIATGLFIRFGIPFLAQAAANATPVSVLQTVSDSAFKSIDGQLLKASKLPPSRATALQAMFQRVTRAIGKNYPYRLELRRGGEQVGANAFALPSGLIVMTDELVALSKDNLELEAVLAHEVGHVTQRHGIRNLYQSVGVVLLAGVFIGDFSSVTGVASSLPVILLQSGYSREFEFESDRIAGKYLLSTTGSTKPMQQMLSRLDQFAQEKRGDNQGLSILRTHPVTNERIQALETMK